MRIMRKIIKKEKKGKTLNDEATDHSPTQRSLQKIIRSFTTRQDISSQIHDKFSLRDEKF